MNVTSTSLQVSKMSNSGKYLFYFLKAFKEKSCKIIIYCKVVNHKDWIKKIRN